jgi:hypothetical protein
MRLSKFMEREGLDDEGMAALVREDGTQCDRTTISRIRRGKVWVSRDIGVRIKAVTNGKVTVDDLLIANEAAG